MINENRHKKSTEVVVDNVVDKRFEVSLSYH